MEFPSNSETLDIGRKRGSQPSISFFNSSWIDGHSTTKNMTKSQQTFAILLFPRGSQRLDMWQRLFEPAVTVSVNQQMAKHKHDGMAVGNEDIEKSQVRYKDCER